MKKAVILYFFAGGVLSCVSAKAQEILIERIPVDAVREAPMASAHPSIEIDLDRLTVERPKSSRIEPAHKDEIALALPIADTLGLPFGEHEDQLDLSTVKRIPVELPELFLIPESQPKTDEKR